MMTVIRVHCLMMTTGCASGSLRLSRSLCASGTSTLYKTFRVGFDGLKVFAIDRGYGKGVS